MGDGRFNTRKIRVPLVDPAKVRVKGAGGFKGRRTFRAIGGGRVAPPRASRPQTGTRGSRPPTHQASIERVECEIDGCPWVQKPFPYQGRCLRWLREARAALTPADRRAADALLAGTGLDRLFAA